MSVADRLRAEAEEELTVLRSSQEDVERELAAAQQKQKEADMQLVTLRGELKESRQRLATLTQAPSQEPDRPNGEPAGTTDNRDGTQRGREGGLYRLGEEGTERGRGRSQNPASTEARTVCKGVTKRYLRNVINEERGGEEVQASETQRTVTTERSR